MPTPGPFTLRLSFLLVDEGFHFERYLADQLDVSARVAHELCPAFELSEPEKAFAKDLLRRKRNLWLYRSHQRLSCGDFVVVDMSAAAPAGRRAVVVELKQRQPLRLGVPATGQLAGAPAAVAELVAAGVLAAESPVELVISDAQQLSDWLG